MRRYTVLETNEDIKWAIETHAKIAAQSNYNFAVLYGNEDNPEKIEFWKAAMPHKDEKPALTWHNPDFECKLHFENGIPIFTEARALPRKKKARK